MTGHDTLHQALDGIDSVALEEIERRAGLQTRVDRKYLVPAGDGIRLVDDAQEAVKVLRIDGASVFRYETIYFDTPDLDSYLMTARRRRGRFKVRIRTYLDSGLCMLEVKRKGRRGETVKLRTRRRDGAEPCLTPEEAAFVDEAVAQQGLAASLRPVLTTAFSRATLLDPRDRSRVTIDVDLAVTEPEGATITIGDHAVVETKSVGAATEVDRWLWAHGHRPRTFSKFCVGMALQHDSLPAHKWNRTLRRDLGWRRGTDDAVPAATPLPPALELVAR